MKKIISDLAILGGKPEFAEALFPRRSVVIHQTCSAQVTTSSDPQYQIECGERVRGLKNHQPADRSSDGGGRVRWMEDLRGGGRQRGRWSHDHVWRRPDDLHRDLLILSLIRLLRKTQERRAVDDRLFHSG